MSRPGTTVLPPMVSRWPSSRGRGRGGAPPILHSILTHKGHKGKAVPRVTETCAPKQCRLQGRARTAETSLPGCGSSRFKGKKTCTRFLMFPLAEQNARKTSASYKLSSLRGKKLARVFLCFPSQKRRQCFRNHRCCK